MNQARDVMDRLTDTVIARHDIDAAMGLYAENAVMMTPDAGEIRGRERIAAYWHEVVDGFPDARYEPIAKLEADGKAVDEGYLIGTNTEALKTPSGEMLPATGKQVKLRSCDVATVRDGMITEHHFYFDEGELMRQLGLTPPS